MQYIRKSKVIIFLINIIHHDIKLYLDFSGYSDLARGFGKLIGIEIVKGKADPNSLYQVDGISGATVTSKGLEKFLLNDLRKYEPFFNKISNYM